VGSGAGAQREDSTAKISGLTNCAPIGEIRSVRFLKIKDVQQKL
jgi:hypothetical protein